MLGEIKMISGGEVPQNWALADGQLLAIAQYPDLYALLGTSFGGDGRTTFQLPDLRGRVPMGNGDGPGLTGRGLGEKLGSETTTSTVAETAAHNHTIETEDVDINDGVDKTITVLKSGGSGVQTSNTGGNQPANNMQPSLGVMFIIRIKEKSCDDESVKPVTTL